MNRKPQDSAWERIGELLDHLPLPALVVNAQHEILGQNHRFRIDFATTEAFRGRTCHATIHALPVPCDRRGETCPLRLCLAASTHSRVSHVHAAPCGRVHQHVTAFPVRDESGTSSRALIALLPPVASVEDRRPVWPVGRSPEFIFALTLVRTAALIDSPVLLLGEPGTGKALLARTIHRLGTRRLRPFVQLDASAFSALETWDAVTGADRPPISIAPSSTALLSGLLAGGTLFVGEVARLSSRSQAMLRALIDSFVDGVDRPRGERGKHVRLVCGTSEDLSAAVAQGRFRSDLYHRIAGFPIRVPPLRDRMEDIPLLVAALLEVVNAPDQGRIGPETLAKLCRLKYPGNIDQLRRIVRALCAGRPAPATKG